jgi:hypothetical protein
MKAKIKEFHKKAYWARQIFKISTLLKNREMKKLFGVSVFVLVIFFSTSSMANFWLVVEKNGNVRSGPGMKYPIVDKVKIGDVIETKGTEQDIDQKTWYPIEVQADNTDTKTITGWFLPIDPNTGHIKIFGESVWFFEEGTEDGKEGYLVTVLSQTKKIPGLGVYTKGKFSNTKPKTKYTKWVSLDFVRVFDHRWQVHSYLELEKTKAEFREYMIKLNENRKKQIDNLNVPDEFKKIIKERKIRLGMTDKQVILSWGKPDDKNSSIGSYGRHEQWIYRIEDFKADYLYFENGILNSYQLSGR